MKITTYKNLKGIVHGKNQKRITCALSGTLLIGSTEVKIVSGEEAIMPLLFHGATGDYDATFAADNGNVYNLGKVAVRGGRIAPPTAVEVELMELHCRADIAESEREALEKRVFILEHLFDTDALNFLIK